MLAALWAWLQQFNVLSLLDWALAVLLLALALYYTRESRAGVLVRGFMVLLVLYLATASLPLVHLILDRLLLAAAIAMGVLFQPEFRRLLEQLAKAIRIEWVDPEGNNEDDPEEELVEEVVQAVRELSQNRTGALIVIEPDQPIDSRVFTDKGVPLQARVSRELLQTIFQTSTLLHDGAVIIHRDRIRAAGVILPVSERTASRQLGTRHRAAMGITEQANCLCIVVSEETGSISLAEGGRLERPLTSAKLHELLVQRLRHPREAKKRDAPLQGLWAHPWIRNGPLRWWGSLPDLAKFPRKPEKTLPKD
ncbi:diadenylate cyclase CdaA [Synechococcus sp. H60.3]|uniref:diadenylate cyclase CdaA n=1 Tax=Synechococcus sp. H60.3 TaxID=2967124 RepID=UPI0039C4D692